MTGAKSPRRAIIIVIVIIIVVAGSGLLLALRMYREDVGELKGFLAAYDRFDTAVADKAVRGTGDEAADVRRPLGELKSRAAMRLSSLIKNDGELMAQAREIADLAEKEVQSREGSPGVDQTSLREKRKAAFARFMKFAGTNGRVGR